jgi:SAM-dependent methyltransferase
MTNMTLQEWLMSTPTGKTILEVEKAWTNQMLTTWFGSYLLHIGEIGAEQFEENSRISRHAVVSPHVTPQTNICSLFDALPFASESVDCVILPHVLEIASDPVSILKEIERILISDGHLIILGFNPYSLIGLWRRTGAWRTIPDLPLQLYSQRQLKLWLIEVGFEIISNFRGFNRPPLSNIKWLEKLQWMEKISLFSNVYGLAIQKRRFISPTPLIRRDCKPHWANLPEATVLRHDNDATR